MQHFLTAVRQKLHSAPLCRFLELSLRLIDEALQLPQTLGAVSRYANLDQRRKEALAFAAMVLADGALG